MAIGFGVFFADDSMAACLHEVSASRRRQGRPEIRIATEKSHAATKIARVIGLEPYTTSAFGASITVAGNVRGKQSRALAQRSQANRIRLSQGCRIRIGFAQGNHDLGALPGSRGVGRIDESHVLAKP